MAVTRINNNQISDASAGNAYVGINAAVKLQNYSVTAGKLANNITYASDLTITGNLTIQGNTTTVDTTYTTIEDPTILLASNQTGAPSVDIGFVGERGTSNNIAFVWDESATEFVTVYTSSAESNTTIAISSYANFHTNDANIGGNIVINGTTSHIGNLIGNVNMTANLAAGNILTNGLVSATGNVTGGNINTGGQVSATANITSAANITGGNLLTSGIVSGSSHIGSVVSVSGNITGGNISTAGSFGAASLSASGNITGNNVIALANVSAVGGYFTGNVTVLGNLNATIGVVYANSGIFYGNTLNGNGAIFAGIPGYTPLGSNVVAQFAGNANSYSQINFQNISNLSAASTDFIATADNGNDSSYYLDLGINSSTFNDQVNYPGFGPNDSYVHNHGGNLILNPESAGKVIKFMVGGTANANVVGNVTTTGLNITGTISASGNITSASNIAGGNLLATTTVSAASHIGSVASLSGNVTGGNLLTGGLISATGNITSAANVAGGNLVATTAVVTPTVIGTTVTVSSTGGLITLAPSSNISVSNKYINNLAQPVQDNDAASKIYVDNMTSTALAYHTAVVAATTGTLEAATGGTITYAQPNGAGNGVGATLTVAGGTFNLIDSANIQTANTRVLVKNQANAALNGVYLWSNATVLTRTSDADTYGPNSSTDLSINDYFFVTGGLVNEGSAWVVDAPSGAITFGTSNITFAQFSSSQVYEANTSAGLSLTGTTFSAKVDNNTTAFDGGGNIIVKASANLTTPNIGAATGTSLSVTGNVTGGNLNTGGQVVATANITGGNLLTSGIVSAASHIGSVVSVTGNITSAANIAGGNMSASGNIAASYFLGNGSQLTGVAANTSGFPITAGTSNIAAATSGNIGVTVAGTSNVLTIASTGTFTTGLASVTGNITGGNLNTGGIVSAAGNIIGGRDLFVGNGAATTSFTNPIGIFKDAGTGYVQVAVVNSTGTASADFTAYSNDGTDAQGWMDMGFTGNTFNDTNYSITLPGDGYLLSQGNAATGGNLVISTGNIGNTRDIVFGFGFLSTNEFVRFQRSTNTILPYANLTANIGSSTKYLSNVFVGNTFGTMISATGNITGANINTGGAGGLILNGANINSNAARITINQIDADVDFAVDGSGQGNVFYVDAGTKTASFGNSTQTTNAIVAFNASNSILFPVGNTAQRPGTGVTGMIRFNSTINAVEVYDNSSWATVGTPIFTVISDQQFNGDGVTVAYTLSAAATTNSVIVSINGVVQIPTIAYSVGGVGSTTLTFTEAPQTGDIIDVRSLITTTQVVSISNSPGNAVVAVNSTSNEVSITGNLVPVSNAIQSLGSPTSNWKSLYVAGNTIYLGGLQLQASGNTFSVYTADGVTQANVDVGNIDVSSIVSGTSTIGISGTNGNAYITVGGTANVLVVNSTGANVTGALAVSGNIVSTGSNGVANIGSATTYFNTVHAKATSAQYADLAENYVADAEYAPGTVLSFGGANEVTVSKLEGDRRIAGVVSTNPSYIMNSVLEAEHVATIALTGRVPTFVSGPVEKGDMMISAGNGRAVACATPVIGTVIGKALENHTGGDGVIEVVVGRL